MEAARRGDLWPMAEALMAFRTGENSEQATIGALVVADAVSCLTSLAGVRK